jgi:hypothetical protein
MLNVREKVEYLTATELLLDKPEHATRNGFLFVENEKTQMKKVIEVLEKYEQPADLINRVNALGAEYKEAKIFSSQGMDSIYPIEASTGKLFDSLVQLDEIVSSWAKNFVNYPIHLPIHIKVKSVHNNTEKNTVSVILSDRHKVTRSFHIGQSDKFEEIQSVWPVDHCFVIGMRIQLKNAKIVPHPDEFKSASSIYNSPDLECRIEQFYDTTSKEVFNNRNYFP